jgi:hypothetical protein
VDNCQEEKPNIRIYNNNNNNNNNNNIVIKIAVTVIIIAIIVVCEMWLYFQVSGVAGTREYFVTDY